MLIDHPSPSFRSSTSRHQSPQPLLQKNKGGLAKELNLAICYLAKASLPMRPSIRLFCNGGSANILVAFALPSTTADSDMSKLLPCKRTSLLMILQRYYLYVQPERTDRFFCYLLHQLARYFRRGYVSMLASSASYSLHKPPLVILMW